MDAVEREKLFFGKCMNNRIGEKYVRGRERSYREFSLEKDFAEN